MWGMIDEEKARRKGRRKARRKARRWSEGCSVCVCRRRTEIADGAAGAAHDVLERAVEGRILVQVVRIVRADAHSRCAKAIGDRAQLWSLDVRALEEILEAGTSESCEVAVALRLIERVLRRARCIERRTGRLQSFAEFIPRSATDNPLLGRRASLASELADDPEPIERKEAVPAEAKAQDPADDRRLCGHLCSAWHSVVMRPCDGKMTEE